MTKVVYVESGIANRFSDHIEMNRFLLEYPKLHDSILKHEMSHTDKQGFNKEDFLLDIGPSNVNYWKLFLFMVKHPKTFKQFAPIYKEGNAMIYDINMIIAWSTLIIVICGAITLSLIL